MRSSRELAEDLFAHALHEHPSDLHVFRRGRKSREERSPNLVRALQYAKDVSATILGVIGRDGG